MQLDDSYESDSSQYDDNGDSVSEALSLTGNDIQNDKFIGENSLNNLHLSSSVKQYFQNFKKISTKVFLKHFNFKDQVPQHKSVCAKPINSGDTIAQCFDCATDKTCIQCIECFKKANHEGHRVIIKKAYGGCCDCGDIEAWKKQGFCTKHTGETIDIHIDPKEEKNFVTEMKELFFLLFWQSIQNNTNNCKQYSIKLLQSLCYLNQKGVYYNKLTCLVFGSKIPQHLIVSKNVNNRTILGNILSPKVAKNLQIDQWMDLFFSMFQYYPFKKLLISTYIKNFSIIYCDEESQMRGNSISCQLLTSHQLVREYTLEEGSIPLGSDIKIEKLASFERPFNMMYHDLDYFIKLSGDTPKVYFSFHMKNRDGILKLFEYRKVIKHLQDKEKDEPDILQLARFVKSFQLEFKALQLVSKIAGILQKDKETLQFVIKTLYKEALQQENQRKLIIFKPLTRALTIFLFAYFDMDLRNLQYNENLERINVFFKALGRNQEEFGNQINKILKVCVESYLFHAKTLAEPGLNSTLYVYIYLYKMINRLISSVDILSVKMFSMMHNWPQINREPLFSPQDYFWQNPFSVTAVAKKLQLESKMENFKFILLELNLITASQSNELYVAYDINSQCGLYQNYIDFLLTKILNQEKNSVSLDIAKKYEESFFHKNVDLAHNYLKKFCNFDKNKKAFILSNPLPSNQSDSLNYSDFRCNLTNKNEFQSPFKTLQLIKFSQSQKIFDSIWSIQTIKKFVVKLIEFMKTYETLTQSNSTDSFIEKFKPLFVQLMKVIYIKKMITKKPQELNIVMEFLRRIQNIEAIVDPFYLSLINPNKMQEEKEEIDKNLEKEGLQKSKSEDQRKKALKERMQQKKKAIKQRYAKQLAEFEKEEKNKLVKEQETEQTQHKLNCIICKNDNQEDLVYFTKISYKNHEKLLKLGDGVNCLSIQSCYHTVDFNCYSKLVSQVGNKKRPVIKCPFCKFRSNTFFPALSQSKLSIEAIKKFEMAIFLEKNIDQISVVEEVIKSFYHFSLLAYLDPQRTMHRRLKIYRIILEILQANSKVYLVEDVYKKFITRTMNLNPKVLEEDDEKRRLEGMFDLKMMLQNSSEEISIEDLSEQQIDNLLNMIAQRQNPQSENPNIGVFGTLVNKLKEKLTSVKKTQSQFNEQKYTVIFKQTIRRLFKFLGFKDFALSQEKSQKIEQQASQRPQNEMIEQELSPELQICLQRLFDQKGSHQTHNQVGIYENNFNESNHLLHLRDLPMNFRPLGRLNKCHYCEQISSSITLCLLCDWQGCLKDCLANKKIAKGREIMQGGVFNHAKVHGEQSLFMMMNKCYVARINTEGLSETLGCIYKDEWGNDFNNKESWESFFLDEGELNKIKLGFLHDQ